MLIIFFYLYTYYKLFFNNFNWRIYMFTKNSFLKSLLVILGAASVACGGGSSNSETSSSSDEVGITLSSALIPASIQELDESKLVYSIEVGEENEYGCLISEEGEPTCPVSSADLEDNDYEMLVTVQYLQDEPGAVAPVALVSSAKLPVFNPDQGKSANNKKPYVIGQAAVKLSPKIIEEVKTGKKPGIVIGASDGIKGDIPVVDFNVNEGAVGRFNAGIICGNNRVEEGEQCELIKAGDNCDSECTPLRYDDVITAGVHFTEDYIIPEGEEVSDTFSFTVEEGQNFIQASTRTLAGDVRTATQIVLYKSLENNGRVEVARSEGLESIIEFHELEAGDYTLVVTKKATSRKQNINAIHVSYALETHLGKSLDLSTIQGQVAALKGFQRQDRDDFFIRVPERPNLNNQLPYRTLQVYTFNEDGTSSNVYDITPTLIPITRNGNFGRISNSLSRENTIFDLDESVHKPLKLNAAIRNSDRMYQLGFSDRPSMIAPGEYILSFDTKDHYGVVNIANDTQDNPEVTINISQENIVEADVCGNGVVETDEVCDGDYCAEDCSKLVRAPFVSAEDILIRADSSDRPDESTGIFRMLGSLNDRIRVTSRTRYGNCFQGSHILKHIMTTDFDSILLSFDVSEFGSDIYTNSLQDESCYTASYLMTQTNPADEIGLFQFEFSNEVYESIDYYLTLERFQNLNADEAKMYHSFLGGSFYESKVEFFMDENDDTEKTDYAVTVRDYATKECLGNLTLKAYSVSDANPDYYSLMERVDAGEDECASLIFTKASDSDAKFEVIKRGSPNLNQEFVLDVVPLVSSFDLINNQRSQFTGVFENLAVNNIYNHNQTLGNNRYQKIAFTIEEDGEYMVYNFPNRVAGVNYRLVAKSGELYDDGYEVVLAGPAEFESIPVLTPGEYHLEIYNNSGRQIEDYQVRMEKSKGVLPGIYTAILPKAQFTIDISEDGDNAGVGLEIQLTDESGSSQAGDCVNPAMSLAVEGLVNPIEILEDHCRLITEVTVDVAPEGDGTVDLDFQLSADALTQISSRPYIYFTVTRN